MELETEWWQILVTVGIYYVILFVHTICAVSLIRCKWIAYIFQKYSILLIIFLMIGTGVYILKDSILFITPEEVKVAEVTVEDAVATAARW